MLSHIATDLHEVYVNEVFEPKLGKQNAIKSKIDSSSDLDKDGDVDSLEKNVRQFIYDVRHLMRKNNLPVERAFQMRSAKTNYGQEVIDTAKEKLGIKGGVKVTEEASGRMVTVTVNYKNGTIDKKNIPYDKVSEYRSKPTVSSVEISSNRSRYDYDRDGRIETPSKEHAGAVHNAIQRKTGGIPDGNDTRKTRREFYSWRDELSDVMNIIENDAKKKVKEKPVDNYKDKTVNLTPEFTENYSFQLIEETVLSEEYLNQVVEVATEFFYNCGLNENGVDIVIEELGEEKFNEFVFDLAEEYFLSEARTLTGKKSSPATGKERGISLKASPGKLTKASVEKHGKTRTLSSSTPSGTLKKKDIGKKITADKADKAIKVAQPSQQPSDRPRKKSIKDRVAGFILKGIERDRAARQTASNLVGQTGQTLKKAASVGSKAATEFATGVKKGVQTTADVAKKTKKAVVGEEYIEEKAESEQQQKLFGLALSVKRGKTSRDEASAEVLKIVDSMSEKEIRKFAGTSHEGIPKKKVNEAISNPEGVKDAVSPLTTQRQKKVVERLLNNARQKRLGEDMQPSTPQQSRAQMELIKAQQKVANANKNTLKKIPTNPEMQNASYEPDGEIIDERRRSEKLGMGSPEKRHPEGPKGLIGGARVGNKERGQSGGRHGWSGGEGGSVNERGKKKGTPGSQEERSNKAQGRNEIPGKYIRQQAQKRGEYIPSN